MNKTLPPSPIERAARKIVQDYYVTSPSGKPVTLADVVSILSSELGESRVAELKLSMQRYEIAEDENAAGEPCMFPADDGDYVLFSDAQSRIATLEKALRDILPFAAQWCADNPPRDDRLVTPNQNLVNKARAALGDQNETR